MCSVSFHLYHIQTYRGVPETAAEVPTDNTTLYTGWLFKQAGSKKNWRKRFFELRRKDMRYFKDRSVCHSDFPQYLFISILLVQRPTRSIPNCWRYINNRGTRGIFYTHSLQPSQWWWWWKPQAPVPDSHC